MVAGRKGHALLAQTETLTIKMEGAFFKMVTLPLCSLRTD